MPKIYATKDPAVSKREQVHMALSRALAGECVVLLENDGVLPLHLPQNLALYGSCVRRTIKGGTGSGDVNTRDQVSVEQGLEHAGFTITTKAWLDRQDLHYEEQRKNYFSWVDQYARENGYMREAVLFLHPFPVLPPVEITAEDLENSHTDTAVYLISRTSGEGSDRRNARGDYLLFPEEQAQLRQLSKAYDKLIVVLNVGSVMDLKEIKEIPGMNALLLMSQLGNVGGDVLGDVLTGAVNPSGKLTDTWARNYEDYPSSAAFSHNDGNVDDEYYTEGIYVGYRYFDSFHVEPIYPFGYGKSYTTFSIHPAGVTVEGEMICVCALVQNTGSCCGKEVVQLYVSSPSVQLPKPYQELLCFEKTKMLAPGEQVLVGLSFPAGQMASYSPADGAWILEPGEYCLRLGNSSRNTQPAGILVLNRLVKTQILKNLFADPDPVQEIDAPSAVMNPPDPAIPRIALSAEAITTHTAVYQTERPVYQTDRTERLTLRDIRQGRCTVSELVAQLTVSEMAELCVGTLRMGEKSVVGNASRLVPGAAGDTSPVVWETRGLRSLILADGPAGLRLQPVFKMDRQGNLLPGGGAMGDAIQPFDAKYTEDNSDTYYQYCTAIPIGWALAQSWNLSLLEEIGSMVGTEMELFGVDLWLAPALNIHRNPLCGRNFEYYSEDPVVSGRAAAAITRGVQRHTGKGTTIKHFAGNSQEENRYFTNSHIGERALREIYLKGFEIAVRESQPLSIMTSYNLINGIHAANSHDLLQAVARDEWGFQGVVMTDWFTSQEQPFVERDHHPIYPISASTGCIFAGNDIQMPGCQQNVDDIVHAVSSAEAVDGYTLTLADLQQNAANVVRAIVQATAADEDLH